MQKIITGTIESLDYEAGTMSAPAFANLRVVTEDDIIEIWAKGRTAKALANAPKGELEFSTEGDEIVAWKKSI